jgi:hypothetical protein
MARARIYRDGPAFHRDYGLSLPAYPMLRVRLTMILFFNHAPSRSTSILSSPLIPQR